MTLLDRLLGRSAPAVPTSAPPTNLDKAILAAAPHVDLNLWKDAIAHAFASFGLTTPRRMAAALGQFAIEAGNDFSATVENLNYTHADRLRAIFPNEFPTLASAQAVVGKPHDIANTAYAHKLGNGDVASGDGWTYRGRGLIQLTGKDEYKAFAAAMSISPEEAAAYCGTYEGAAVSGCWYFVWRKLLPAMDAWNLDAVTRGVNGNGMTNATGRRTSSEAALKAFEP